MNKLETHAWAMYHALKTYTDNDAIYDAVTGDPYTFEEIEDSLLSHYTAAPMNSLYVLEVREHGETYRRFYLHKGTANEAWIEAVLHYAAMYDVPCDEARLRECGDGLTGEDLYSETLYLDLILAAEKSANDDFWILLNIEKFEDYTNE